ncbi:transcriptional regulator, LacI family [Flavobacteriaceae bacterium MAR_2010_188]|nr:transcriptional regulator, LacI family [Flavobacteriaceae bacterium MAR_2010_188]
MASVTLKQIADSLGISTATVSKALKDYPDISEKTKIKVKELAEKLNYKPNPFAQSLRNNESKMIGLIIPQVVHHFFSNIINGVINAAAEKGYLVITLQSEESYEHEKEQINLLIDKNVDGILLSLSDKTVHYKHINAIIDGGIPVVLYDKISKLINCSKVIIDDRLASQKAVQHLIDTGCKKIAHIRGSLKPQTTIDRLMGYRKALEVNGIKYDDSLVYESLDLSFEDGYRLAGTIIEDHKDVDGIFAFADLIATGALIRLKESGVKIPEDISIIGFSNWFLTKVTSPSLSTVDQPGYQMGVEAFDLLYENIQDLKHGRPVNHKVVEISTKIIARNSTRPMVNSK